MAMISLESVNFRYSESWVLENISFDVKDGEFLGIIGPNGTGKTTILKIIDGILAPERGDVRLGKLSVSSMKRNAIARMVAVVPQESPMVFPFTVKEVVMMGRSPYIKGIRFETGEDMEIVHRAMEMTETLALEGRTMNELSGGERQRVLMARALAQETSIMLLDESTAFLDIGHQIALFELIRALNRRNGLTVVAVTHDINLAALFCDRILLLNEGRVNSIGIPSEVITEEKIKEVYRAKVLVDVIPDSLSPRVTLLSTSSSNKGSR